VADQTVLSGLGRHPDRHAWLRRSVGHPDDRPRPATQPN
jgi:hypothetical protein